MIMRVLFFFILLFVNISPVHGAANEEQLQRSSPEEASRHPLLTHESVFISDSVTYHLADAARVEPVSYKAGPFSETKGEKNGYAAKIRNWTEFYVSFNLFKTDVRPLMQFMIAVKLKPEEETLLEGIEKKQYSRYWELFNAAKRV
ncbi:hypothetical protein OAN22_02350 [Alphaproteobacteria bacterium]|nr:hypothetical protein [Alphaproteobacteria bacterium]